MEDLEATNINIGLDTVEVRSTEALAKADTSRDTGRGEPAAGRDVRHRYALPAGRPPAPVCLASSRASLPS